MALTVAILAAFTAIIAATIAPWISHSIKISEFRQAWINDLRRDIADYLGVSERWFRKYEEINHMAAGDPLKGDRERTELFPIANEAKVILRRIRLRFNPTDNRHKAEDDAFLKSLDDMLNPGKCAPPQPDVSWQKLADDSVQQARRILKREWEVTKKLPVPWKQRRKTDLV
jgi:hypothetical protein